MTDEFDCYISDRPSSNRWWSRLTWPTLLFLAWAIYELTAQPALGAFAICTKFGWQEFKTAGWLLWIDPERKWGRNCFWLCLALGLGKILVASYALMIASGMVIDAFGQEKFKDFLDKPDTPLRGIVLALVVSLALFAFTCLLAYWRRHAQSPSAQIIFDRLTMAGGAKLIRQMYAKHARDLQKLDDELAAMVARELAQNEPSRGSAK
jgi:hypothetical protein